MQKSHKTITVATKNRSDIYIFCLKVKKMIPRLLKYLPKLDKRLSESISKEGESTTF